MGKVQKHILIVLLIVLFAGTVHAATFGWTKTPSPCFSGVCGSYIIIWRAADYATVCPQDVLEEVTDCKADPDGCTEYFVPSTCYQQLLTIIAAKVKVLPESYDTVEFTVRKSHAPLLESNSRYVSVSIAYAVTNGKELESDFSNRIVWKTPITIKPFGIDIE